MGRWPVTCVVVELLVVTAGSIFCWLSSGKYAAEHAMRLVFAGVPVLQRRLVGRQAGATAVISECLFFVHLTFTFLHLTLSPNCYPRAAWEVGRIMSN